MDYKFMTPVELWADCNPVAESLDIEVARTWENEGAVYEKIYFTVKKAGEAELRAYVLTARPKKKGKYPTIFILPELSGKELDESLFGGMETEGYCMVAVDLDGETEGKSRYTFYPDELDYCNKTRAGRHLYYAEPSAKETAWYGWTYVARRTITLISELSYADSDKIIITGAGDSCPVLWQTAAMDARLSGAISVFGYKLEEKESEQEEMDCWTSGVDMRSYAPFVTMPILHIGGTNTADDILEINEKAVEMNEKLQFYADYVFGNGLCVTRKQIATAKEFIKKVFAGEEFTACPTFETETGIDGEFKVKITANGAKSAELWYAYVGASESMFWKKVDASKKSGEFIASFSLALSDEKVAIYARANYGKYCLTSRPKFIQASKTGASVPDKRSTKILFDGTSDKAILPIQSGKLVKDDALEIKEGALGLMGITAKEGGLGYVFDPEQPIELKLAESLQFEIFTLTDVEVVVRLKSSEDTFTASKNFRGGTGWQRVQLSFSAFKNSEFQKLSSFEEVWKIEFPNIAGVLLRNVLLI